MFTKLPELSTSLTNVIIFIVALYSFIKTNKSLWKLFFLLLSMAALMGSIIHGFVMSSILKFNLWLILYLIFDILINVLFACSLSLLDKYKNRNYSLFIIISSVILYISTLVCEFNNVDFLSYFIYYAGAILLIILFIYIKMAKTNKYFLESIIFQLIGGIILLLKFKTSTLDYNGYYHIFMALTTYYFYKGVKKE